MNELKVRITNNYGKEAIYPANDVAFGFAKLTGTKTLTRYALNTIKSLGYNITIEQATL